jgi:hypothetical protein
MMDFEALAARLWAAVVAVFFGVFVPVSGEQRRTPAFSPNATRLPKPESSTARPMLTPG